MKKHLLILSVFVVTFSSAFAAELNPFAYNLKSEYNDKTQTLTINFTLNAPASYVKLAISDGTSDVWTKEYLASSYQAGKVPKATYTETINALTLPQGKSLTWRVDVKGAAVGSPTFVKNDVRLYAPTSVDIDNNPENANFGTVFCVEGRNGAYQTSGYTGYISYADGAGLYVLNADGTARKMPFQTEKVRYGYNGGVVNTDKDGNDDRDKPFFGNNGEYDLNGYNAYRVRVSDDGRIFVTAFSTNGHVLWEAKKECFSATTQAEWSANTGWHKVMVNGNANTFMATAKRDCDNNHQYCGIFSLFQNNASTGTFIAGPNLGFDVRGSGENLKLLMLSGCQQAIVYSTPAHFYCDEYDLGTAHLFNDPTKRTRIFAGHSNGVDIVNAPGVQVQYDKSGNVWMCQHRGVTSNTTLARVNRTLSSTKENNVNEGQVDYSESNHTYRRCGAIRFNEDFTQVAIASNAHGAGGGFTVYPVNASGLPDWNSGTQVDTYTKTGNSLMDFAWDYAGNLYIAANASDKGKRIAVYAMPHAADRVVSTPAADKYAFTVSCQAGKQCTVNTVCNPEVGGTITCSVGGNARAAGVLTLESCTELTVTAVPEDGYKFLNWTDGNDNVLSTNKEFTFYVTEDITLKANFEYATYTGIVWKNLFLGGPDNDIATETAEYPNTNERLWRLFQVEYYKYRSTKRKDKGYETISGKKEFDVADFLSTSREDHVKFLTAETHSAETPFSWLGKYIEYVNGKEIIKKKYPVEARWQYIMYMFINRTNTTYNSSGAKTDDIVQLDSDKSFVDYGKPEKWRFWWTRLACGLSDTMMYNDPMPVTWTALACSSDPIYNDANAVVATPSSWYQWNTAPDGKDFDESAYLLAWRKGSTTGPIVTRIQESNLALYATYVKKNINENGGVNEPNNHSATNADVLQLLKNENYGDAAEHTITVTRPLKAGMYNTICLPFSLSSLDGTPLAGATVMEFTGVDKNLYNDSGDPVTVLNFTEVNAIEAGKPYLIKLNADSADITGEMRFEDIPILSFITQPAEPITHGAFTFLGTIDPTPLDAGALMLVADNRLAINTEDQSVMKGLRGYFTINPMAADMQEMAAAGRVYLSMKKPVTTSVPLAPEAEKQTAPEVRKVMYDGKIYILRDNEVYSITGQRIK